MKMPHYMKQMEIDGRKYIPLMETAILLKHNQIAVLKRDIANDEKDWFEKARKHLELFGQQHPEYSIDDYRVLNLISCWSFDSIDWGNIKNKSHGCLSSIARVEESWCNKKYTWITDRKPNYFAAYNKKTNNLYYELAGDSTPHKINLARNFEKIERVLQLFAINNCLNIEEKRVMIEEFGEDKYMESLEAKIIAEDTDHQGNKRQLLKIGNYGGLTPNGSKEITVVKVICPSTGRTYFLKPPNQHSTNCQQAVNSTFKIQDVDKTLAYRHGDVGLIPKEGYVTQPFSES